MVAPSTTFVIILRRAWLIVKERILWCRDFIGINATAINCGTVFYERFPLAGLQTNFLNVPSSITPPSCDIGVNGSRIISL